VQGERPMANQNVSLGKFQLVGIPPAPRGVPQIEVTYDIDANGLLTVVALDKATGKKQDMKIIAPQKMSEDDINSKVKEAEQYSEEDKKMLDLAQAKNEAETMVYAADKTLGDFKDKLKEDQKKEIEDSKAKVKEAMAGTDTAKIRTEMDNLKKTLEKVGASLYQGGAQGMGGQQPPPGGPGAQPPPGGDNGNAQPPPGSESGWEDPNQGQK